MPEMIMFAGLPAFLGLPSSDAPPTDAEERSEALRAVRKAKGLVVVIDDEEGIADSVAEILRTRGYDAIAFYDGRAALDYAREHCPDFVVSDVIMPRLNGIDTAISVINLCPDAKVLLFSGQTATVNLLSRARAQGYNFELLPKPVHPERLLSKLDGLRRA
jgi:DNA-binding NtrC family response regulator